LHPAQRHSRHASSGKGAGRVSGKTKEQN
jgi:hypothetical protein